MTKPRVLRIGIASRETMKQRTIAIAKGKLRPSPNEPRVWFTSLESLGKVLSQKNMLLLEIIRNQKPRSLAELAALSGRQMSNLSRTVRNMERLGLLEIREENQRKVPIVKYDRFQCNFELGDKPQQEAAKAVA